MNDYIINVAQIEELQILRDREGLEQIFNRARSAIVNGAKAVLVRQGRATPAEKFDEFSTLPDLQAYRKHVFKYL